MTTREQWQPPVIGIDLGGTAARVILWQNSAIAGQRTAATANLMRLPEQERVPRLWAMARELIRGAESVAAVGIGASGPIDPSTGIISNPGTLPGFTGFDLPARLRALTGLPVVIDNDAVTAAIGEHGFGAGQNAGRMLMVTLGTGIGAALLVNGLPFQLADGTHPEAGHIAIGGNQAACYCGITGCWEPAASRPALEIMLRDATGAVNDPSSAVPDAARLAAGGNPDCQRIFETYGYQIGRGLNVLHSVYGPEVIVIGGSVAEHLELLRPAIAQAMRRSPEYQRPVAVAAARLGHAAGAVGAAVMALRRYGST